MWRCVDGLLKQSDFGGVVLRCLGAFSLLAQVMRQAALKTAIARGVEFVRNIRRFGPIARALINTQ